MVKARRVVEIAFGKVKGRFHILDRNFVSDPLFIAGITLLCCALNNMCYGAQCPFSENWLAEDIVPVAFQAGPGGGDGGGGDGGGGGVNGAGVTVRLAVAEHVQGIAPLQ